ncbi:MAG: hypothetical protein ACOH2H_26375, partial [Cypionkella sp.]
SPSRRRRCIDHVRQTLSVGGACDTFDIKIQDPASVRWVVEVCREIAAKFGEKEEPVVSGVEFSLDAYPREPSYDARAMLLGVMQRTIFTHRDIVTKKASRPRSTTKSAMPETTGPNLPQAKKLQNRKLFIEGVTGKPNYNYTVAENHRTPFIDGTMYFGAKKDDVMIKIMHKTIDEQKPAQKSSEGSAKILTEIERRVRIEVTIQGKELDEIGFRNLADLQGFKFSKLQGRYFQFKLPTFRDALNSVSSGASAVLAEMEKRRAEIFLKSGVVGLNASEEERANERARMLPGIRKALRSEGRTLKLKRTGQGETGTFVAYAELNHLAALSFRHLGNREGRAWAKKVRSELL